MATKVYMEALSPTMEEGRIVNWLKHEGDTVMDGDVLAEVETDKAIMELQARGEGVLRKTLAAEGATVEVGSVIGVIAAADEDIAGVLQTVGAVGRESPTDAPSAAPAGDANAMPRLEPAASDDIPRATGRAAPRVKSSPLARRLARERQIDLRVVEGSGPGGRIVKRDVEAAIPGVRRPLSAHDDVPLSQLRKTIAARLSSSLGPIPHFFLTSEIDMERTAEAREALNDLGDPHRISYNDIVIKAVAEALHQHPECNASWQDDFIRYFNEVHIAVAVAVEDGLITPVIRNAERKSLREISAEVRELAQRARERKLKPDEYTGGTFSISNLGMFDIDQFTAVLNPPEAGILAVGSVAERPVVLDGDLMVRKRMRVTMSCDHRVIDGATGARFLQTVKRMLENPMALVW